MVENDLSAHSPHCVESVTNFLQNFFITHHWKNYTSFYTSLQTDNISIKIILAAPHRNLPMVVVEIFRCRTGKYSVCQLNTEPAGCECLFWENKDFQSEERKIFSLKERFSWWIEWLAPYFYFGMDFKLQTENL